MGWDICPALQVLLAPSFQPEGPQKGTGFDPPRIFIDKAIVIGDAPCSRRFRT